MKNFAYIFIVLFLIGCGLGGDNKSSSTTTTTNTINSETETYESKCIDLYTLGNIVNAVVIDNAGQIATYDRNISKYCFNNTINYPVKARILEDTFVDVDYDNQMSANDIKPKIRELKSYFSYIDLITNMHAVAVDNNLSVDNNTTLLSAIDFYKKTIENYYNIDLDNPSINEKILNFTAYDYYIYNSSLPTINTNLFDSYNSLVIFFENYLNIPTISDSVKYYSFYHSLEFLDKRLIQRVDTIHRPNITYLHINNLPVMDSSVINSYYYDIITKDIKLNDNGIYVASGFDGVAKFLYSTPQFILNNKIQFNDTFSNSYNLEIFSYFENNTKKEFLFVANGGDALKVIDITGGNFTNIANLIFWKYYDVKSDKNVSITLDDTSGIKQIDEVINVKTYISPFQNKIWLAFGTKNNGLYLVDLKKILPKFSNPTYPLIVYDTTDDENNNLWIPGDSGTVYSEAFSSDGENIYASKENYIQRYDISSVMQLYNPTPIKYNIKANNAYTLKMITNNGIDELFVSTNRGVEVYDVLNNGDLSFISEYTTEGAQVGYQPKMEYISDKNMLLFTDGYKGLKILKYDASYKPMLCGVGYFSPYSDFTKLAKVTSVVSYFNYNDNNYYVIVGVEGYGLLQLKLDDLLFKHCK